MSAQNPPRAYLQSLVLASTLALLILIMAAIVGCGDKPQSHAAEPSAAQQAIDSGEALSSTELSAAKAKFEAQAAQQVTIDNAMAEAAALEAAINAELHAEE